MGAGETQMRRCAGGRRRVKQHWRRPSSSHPWRSLAALGRLKLPLPGARDKGFGRTLNRTLAGVAFTQQGGVISVTSLQRAIN